MKHLTLDSVRGMNREDAIESLEYLINMDYHLNSPIIEIPNFIPDSDCDYISETIKKYMNDNPSKIFKNTVRIGESLTISKIPELEEIEKYLYNNFSKRIYEEVIPKNMYYKNFINEWGIEVSDNGYDFHHYKDLDYCVRHSDNHFHSSRNDMPEEVFIFASCGLCLNTPKVGGEIVFPHLNKMIKSEKGKVTIWSPHPFYEHYTNPTKNDHRDVLLTWMQYSNKVIIDNDYYDNLVNDSKTLNGLI